MEGQGARMDCGYDAVNDARKEKGDCFIILYVPAYHES